MKKKNLKSLKLNKKSVSDLNPTHIVGGASDSPTCNNTCASCDCGPIDIPSFDFPTINDSCFSWCNDKCNDF